MLLNFHKLSFLCLKGESFCHFSGQKFHLIIKHKYHLFDNSSSEIRQIELGIFIFASWTYSFNNFISYFEII